MKISKADFCTKNKIDERTCERWAKAGKIKVVYEKGKAFIYDETEIAKVKLNKKELRILKANLKAQFNIRIKDIANRITTICSSKEYKEGDEDIERRTVVNEIVAEYESWKKSGVKVSGYSETKVYDKIRKCISGKKNKVLNPLQKKSYSNKGKVVNKFLAKVETLPTGEVIYPIQRDILGLGFKFYDEPGNRSVRQAALRVHMLAQNSEEHWEIAAIPFNTVYDFLNAGIKKYSYDQRHLMVNNFNEWRQKRIYVEGAFTEEASFGFMEMYQIDDHNQEISGVLEYDEIKREWLPKKVTMWMVSDVRTSKCLGYMQKPDSFKANDIKLLLFQVIQQWGKPVKGILMDNGLAASSTVTEFLVELGIPFFTGGAYEPLHKAIKEREFGYIKTEFNSNFENYIGGGRKEVRHKNKKLSPEEAKIFFSEYQDAFENYIKGYYETKPRQKTTNFKTETISIRQQWESYYPKHTWNYVPRQELNYAFKEFKVKKFGNYWLNMGKEMGVYDAGSVDYIHPGYIGLEYAVFYNPLDTNHVDLYATEFFEIPENGGVYYDVGDYVMTLDSQRKKGTAKRQADAKRLHALLQKQIKQLGKTISDAVQFEDVGAAMPELNIKGEYDNPIKKQEKEAKELIDESAKSVKKLLQKKNLGKTPMKLNKVSEPTKEITHLTPEQLIAKWGGGEL